MSDRARLMGGLSDAALLSAVAVGDDVAFTVFVRRFQSQVFGLAVHLCSDPGLAEDVAQQTFERTWRHATVFDERRGSVRTWTLTICRRLAIDALRVRRPKPFDPAAFESLTTAAAPSPEDLACDPTVASQLRVALASLAEPQRRAVLLAAVAGHTASEIADIESIPLGTAKTRLRAGLAALRSQLTERHDG